MGRDIYADLAKIEERGKRKKKKGFLSFIGSDKDAGEDAPPAHAVSAFSGIPADPAPPVTKPEAQAPEEAAPKVAPAEDAEKDPEPKDEWAPLKGRKRRLAEDNLHDYKKMLEKNFRAGRMSKAECRARAKAKEIELGLIPPDDE